MIGVTVVVDVPLWGDVMADPCAGQDVVVAALVAVHWDASKARSASAAATRIW